MVGRAVAVCEALEVGMEEREVMGEGLVLLAEIEFASICDRRCPCDILFRGWSSGGRVWGADEVERARGHR